MNLYRDRQVLLLMVEDLDEDYVLFRETVRDQRQPALVVERVARLAQAIAWLDAHTPDLVLLDLNLPDSRGLATFERLSEHTRRPIVVLSGVDNEDLAVEALHKGAQDYLVKGEADRKALVRSILYAIERHRLQHALAEAHQEIQSLRGMIPICAYCRRVRHDDGYWQQLESYISQIGHVNFSHGICPDCFARLEAQLRQKAIDQGREPG